MSANPPSIDRELADLLLDALGLDEHTEGRVRGGEIGRPAYHLHRWSLPESLVSPVTSARQAARGGTQSALVPETPPQLAHAEGEPMVCSACGATNPPTHRFCAACGHDMRSQPTTGAALAVDERPLADTRFALITINESGEDGVRHGLEFRETTLGRAADIRFPTDVFLSPKHARFVVEKGELFLEDLYSLNGTFVKLQEEVRLTPGDTFLMGRQVLRFERLEQDISPRARAADGTRYMGSPPPGGTFKLVQVGIAGIVQNVYCMAEPGALIGREKGDIIFRADQFMSSTHAHVQLRDDGHYYLQDLGSSNGTWLKIWERRRLRIGDFVFMGQQLFRVGGS